MQAVADRARRLVETKVIRHVRTEAGVRRYKQPIGSIIINDGLLVGLTEIGTSNERGMKHDTVHLRGENGKTYTIRPEGTQARTSYWVAVEDGAGNKPPKVLYEGPDQVAAYAHTARRVQEEAGIDTRGPARLGSSGDRPRWSSNQVAAASDEIAAWSNTMEEYGYGLQGALYDIADRLGEGPNPHRDIRVARHELEQLRDKTREADRDPAYEEVRKYGGTAELTLNSAIQVAIDEGKLPKRYDAETEAAYAAEVAQQTQANAGKPRPIKNGDLHAGIWVRNLDKEGNPKSDWVKIRSIGEQGLRPGSSRLIRGVDRNGKPATFYRMSSREKWETVADPANIPDTEAPRVEVSQPTQRRSIDGYDDVLDILTEASGVQSDLAFTQDIVKRIKDIQSGKSGTDTPESAARSLRIRATTNQRTVNGSRNPLERQRAINAWLDAANILDPSKANEPGNQPGPSHLRDEQLKKRAARFVARHQAAELTAKLVDEAGSKPFNPGVEPMESEYDGFNKYKLANGRIVYAADERNSSGKLTTVVYDENDNELGKAGSGDALVDLFDRLGGEAVGTPPADTDKTVSKAERSRLSSFTNLKPVDSEYDGFSKIVGVNGRQFYIPTHTGASGSVVAVDEDDNEVARGPWLEAVYDQLNKLSADKPAKRDPHAEWRAAMERAGKIPTSSLMQRVDDKDKVRPNLRKVESEYDGYEKFTGANGEDYYIEKNGREYTAYDKDDNVIAISTRNGLLDVLDVRASEPIGGIRAQTFDEEPSAPEPAPKKLNRNLDTGNLKRLKSKFTGWKRYKLPDGRTVDVGEATDDDGRWYATGKDGWDDIIADGDTESEVTDKLKALAGSAPSKSVASSSGIMGMTQTEVDAARKRAERNGTADYLRGNIRGRGTPGQSFDRDAFSMTPGQVPNHDPEIEARQAQEERAARGDNGSFGDELAQARQAVADLRKREKNSTPLIAGIAPPSGLSQEDWHRRAADELSKLSAESVVPGTEMEQLQRMSRGLDDGTVAPASAAIWLRGRQDTGSAEKRRLYREAADRITSGGAPSNEPQRAPGPILGDMDEGTAARTVHGLADGFEPTTKPYVTARRIGRELDEGNISTREAARDLDRYAVNEPDMGTRQRFNAVAEELRSADKRTPEQIRADVAERRRQAVLASRVAKPPTSINEPGVSILDRSPNEVLRNSRPLKDSDAKLLNLDGDRNGAGRARRLISPNNRNMSDRISRLVGNDGEGYDQLQDRATENYLNGMTHAAAWKEAIEVAEKISNDNRTQAHGMTRGDDGMYTVIGYYRDGTQHTYGVYRNASDAESEYRRLNRFSTIAAAKSVPVTGDPDPAVVAGNIALARNKVLGTSPAAQTAERAVNASLGTPNVSPALRRTTPRMDDPDYKKAYERGYNASRTNNGRDRLERADDRNEPDAWYDGWGDWVDGSGKWGTPKKLDEEEFSAVNGANRLDQMSNLDRANNLRKFTQNGPDYNRSVVENLGRYRDWTRKGDADFARISLIRAEAAAGLRPSEDVNAAYDELQKRHDAEQAARAVEVNRSKRQLSATEAAETYDRLNRNGSREANVAAARKLAADDPAKFMEVMAEGAFGAKRREKQSDFGSVKIKMQDAYDMLRQRAVEIRANPSLGNIQALLHNVRINYGSSSVVDRAMRTIVKIMDEEYK